MTTRCRMLWVTAGFGLLALAVLVLCVAVGPGGLGDADVVEALRALLGMEHGREGVPDLTSAVIRRIRLPRVLAGLLAGGVLSLGGLVFQALLRNPLAEPYILGVSGGAAVGAICGQLLGLAALHSNGVFAFAGGLAATALVLAISPLRKGVGGDTLLLAGVMINAFCSAVILFLMTLGSVREVHSIVFWLMGSLSGTGPGDVSATALVVLPCMLCVVVFSHQLNLLAMGDTMAQSLGVAVRPVVLALFTLVSLMVGAVVAKCGLIGFVGLVVPHFLRLLLGADHRVLVPACILGGGAYLGLCDMLARTVPQQGEIPVGVVTALIGAPVFIGFLILRGRGGRSS